MSNLIQHAERELAAVGEMVFSGMMEQSVMQLISVFAYQGHSGGSAPICASLFARLANYEPLCPLTGEDDEWVEVSDGVLQNVRCSHVFKQQDRFGGQAYDIDGKIFREPSGACYTNNESNVPITFPYTPRREIVDVLAPDEPEAKATKP